MDTRTEIRDLLTSRRAKLTPDQVGLPDYGTRRVPGLRREEVAVLAGVSVPYHTRAESATRRRRPSRQHVRPSVRHILDAITGAPAFVRNRDLSDLVADPGLTVFAYTAEPGSRHAEALQLLASWTAEALPAIGA